MYSPLNVSYIRHPNVAASQLELSNQFAEMVELQPVPIKHYSGCVCLGFICRSRCKKNTLFLEQQKGKSWGSAHNECVY